MRKLTRSDLVLITEAALLELGGSGTVVQVAEQIWKKHADDLKNSGPLFYTWQYDMRWAASNLRKLGKLVDATVSDRGTWQLK